MPAMELSMPPPETNAIEIVINGERRRVPPGMSLEGLLLHLNVDQSTVAVEYNREIIKKTIWNRTAIGSGDELEIVQFVGGG